MSMQPAPPPTLLTVPTELERTDGFMDLSVLVGSLLGIWWLNLKLGIPFELSLPCLVPMAIWVLTGEAAGDVPFLGVLASGLRSALGMRRAHEWVFALWHFYVVAIWPIWRQRCGTFLRSTRLRITALRLRVLNHAGH